MNIEIIPKKLSGTVTAPSSKSVAHRALICAALADGKSTLKISGISDDIKATVRCVEQLGARVEISGENVTVVPPERIPEKATFDCGESGSTLRFILPVAVALGIESIFTGSERLFERPVAPLLDELKNHNVRCGRAFPLTVSGKMQGGDFSITGEISSQFVSGLLLAMPLCGGRLKVSGELVSKPYVDMTVGVMKQFGIEIGNNFEIKKQTYHKNNFCVEGDWSNAAYFLSLGVTVKNLNKNSTQGDKKILEILKNFPSEIDASDTPDLVPLSAVIAADKKGKTVIKNVSRLRHKESDRILSTVEMINALGGKAEETKNEIIITGVEKLCGGTVDSFNDHRIVMAAAVAAAKCTGKVTIKNAEAVSKSYPDFFDVYNSLGGAAYVV